MATNNNISSRSSSSSRGVELFRRMNRNPPEKKVLQNRISEFLTWYRKSKNVLPASSSNNIKLRPSEEVLEKTREQLKDIRAGTVIFSDLAPNNTEFDKNAQRIVLKDSEKFFTPTKVTREPYELTARVVEALCLHNRKRTLRHLFYMFRSIFRTQTRSDSAVNQLCSKIGASRPSLNLIAGDRGFVIGSLTYTLYNKLKIDCNNESGSEILIKVGQIVPPDLRSVSKIDGKRAMFILVVESLAVYNKLAGENFHNEYDCIIMTGKGMSDLALREFTKYLMEELDIPVFFLSDCDPYGIEIYAVYKYGSENMAFDNENLANPQIYWLGIWPTDLIQYDIEPEEMSTKDVEENSKTDQLKKKEFVASDALLKRELDHMGNHKKQASICALSQFGFDGLTRYLRLKLYEVMGDIIR